MRIAVIGAGIVGVAAAHALAERGHEVHVYDRRSDVASDTSASTAGLVAPGHSYAWASPKAPAMLVKSLLGESTSIRVRPRADADLVRWGLRFIRECTPSRSRTNTLSKLRLARYSQQLMDELAAREGLQYWQTHAGVLYLFHEEADLLAAEQNSRLLQRAWSSPGGPRLRRRPSRWNRHWATVARGSRARSTTRPTAPATRNSSRSAWRRCAARSG